MKTSAVVLADQLCTVVLEIRAFGEANSPYLTRLDNETNKKGWTLSAKRKATIKKELEERGTQIQSLVMRLESALNEFGRITPTEQSILRRYWDEADKVQRLFIDGVVALERKLGFNIYTAPFKTFFQFQK